MFCVKWPLLALWNQHDLLQLPCQPKEAESHFSPDSSIHPSSIEWSCTGEKFYRHALEVRKRALEADAAAKKMTRTAARSSVAGGPLHVVNDQELAEPLARRELQSKLP